MGWSIYYWNFCHQWLRRGWYFIIYSGRNGNDETHTRMRISSYNNKNNCRVVTKATRTMTTKTKIMMMMKIMMAFLCLFVRTRIRFCQGEKHQKKKKTPAIVLIVNIIANNIMITMIVVVIMMILIYTSAIIITTMRWKVGAVRFWRVWDWMRIFWWMNANGCSSRGLGKNIGEKVNQNKRVENGS